MSGTSQPIFYDPKQRRRPIALTLALALSVPATLFCVSLVAIPLLPAIKLSKPSFARDLDLDNPALTSREAFRRRLLLRRDKRRPEREERAEQAIIGGRGSTPRPVVAAYYVDWDETSLASLKTHAGELTHLMPEWLHLNRDARSFTSELKPAASLGAAAASDPALQALAVARQHGLAVLPLLNNYADDSWHGDWLHALLDDPARRAALIGQLRQFLATNHLQGINIDFEELDPNDGAELVLFMRELQDALAPAGLLVTQDVPADDDTYRLPELARICDFLMPMLYDQHWSESGPGPIAPQAWFERRLDAWCAQVPASKLVLAIGNYAYDWENGRPGAESDTFQGAVLTAKESFNAGDGSGIVRLDPASRNPYFRYYDDDAKPHQVWMLDAVTAYNEWRYARRKAPLGIGLWYLGSEDPSLWSFFGRGHLLTPPPATALSRVRYGFEIDFEGEGEILQVVGTPQEGERTLRVAADGSVVGEQFDRYPSTYVIRRSGTAKKTVALTFDDGPDPRYTPQVLAILRRYHAHATFFLIGENAEANPSLTRRIWDEGNEIGNHTFQHPNIAAISERRTDLELNATQRAIESLIGRKTPLFRPPYEADAEPATADEVVPLARAKEMGYITIGEKIDPLDWDTAHGARADQIAQRVLSGLGDGNIVLLHDGGGDRSQTVAALPQILAGLRQHGYRIVTISELMGRSRDRLFPKISGSEALLVGADRLVFDLAFGTDRLLHLLFLLSILLGISRIVAVAMLACAQARVRRNRRFDCAYGPRTSVVIAAYNEAPVICRTIASVLGSDYPNLEVIVVDDGSADGTAEAVQAAYGGDPRVRLYTKPNGGKASALNLGIGHAAGEVIVSLDADTLFAPETISRLVRHFQDPAVGAVAGNVKVGNAFNVLTRWQAIEYITSQNFDRRAYDLLNCITVVPGAVGAWRREAIERAGGYSSQTLAEDTDLTFTIRKLGYRIVTENEARAFTEAPDGLRALAKQRFRWAFGTLQNLWKHRNALLRPRYGAFGLVALPGLWVYQILFQAVAPAVDLGVLLSVAMGDYTKILFYYGLFFTADLVGAAVAFDLEAEDRRLLLWIFWQRFVYRQLMYYVIVKSILHAIGGKATGWGKLERKGTAQLADARQ
jgi:cellulose synthase/poly-beta-1,6-N-acetylglucosamine synthase-like glycosyltransferase/peptidoglycan/xylan/chitin deacetylase (PgdA/CDA1 family)/spore germination protein YaaH